MTPIPIAVVGAGPWGRTVATAISVTRGVSLAALVSSDRDVRMPVTSPVPVYRTWREAVEGTDVSVFVLAVPPMYQPKIARELIENGLPVMLEKPMATTVADAKSIRRGAETHGFTGLVNHLHLYAPAFRTLLARVADEPGERHIRTTAGARGPYRAGWTPLWDWAGHDFAMALSVVESAPVLISVVAGESLSEDGKYYRNYRIELEFGDGSRGEMHIGNAFDRKVREFHVGTHGTNYCYRETEAIRTSLSIDGVEISDIGINTESRPLNAALIAFASRIRDGGGMDDIILGEEVVRLIAAAEESLHSGRPVELPETGAL